MTTPTEKAFEIESAYLAGVQANLKAAGSRFVRGTMFKHEEHDAGERVRAAMIERRIYDKQRYSNMPHGRGFTVRGFERRFLFGRRCGASRSRPSWPRPSRCSHPTAPRRP
jgi:hypothetical protein